MLVYFSHISSFSFIYTKKYERNKPTLAKNGGYISEYLRGGKPKALWETGG
jgi:hypothetical protein